MHVSTHEYVTPLVGVWIEILSLQVLYAFPSSLPLWECGLKYGIGVDNKTVSRSLPLWECGLKSRVTLHIRGKTTSLPLWECGLKSCATQADVRAAVVTPLVGVWIEINVGSTLYLAHKRHSPCGSVD